MSESMIIRYVNSRQPPLYGTITTDFPGDPIPAGATVSFYMRNVTTNTLKVNGAAAVIDNSTTGDVHYNWTALDVDTEGVYVGWWRVTLSGGQYEETPEDPIWFRSHAPVSPQYVSAAELKDALSLGGETYADNQIDRALRSASNVVDSITGRSFGLATAGTQLFTPISETYLIIGDVTSVTSVTVDGVVWVAGTDFFLDGGDTLRVLGGRRFPRAEHSVSVAANYGFAAVPPEIVDAVMIIATQILRRIREAPFGILATAMDGPAIRLGRSDPQVDALLAEHTRSSMIE